MKFLVLSNFQVTVMETIARVFGTGLGLLGVFYLWQYVSTPLAITALVASLAAESFLLYFAIEDVNILVKQKEDKDGETDSEEDS